MSNKLKVFTECGYDGTTALRVLGDKNNPWFICREVFDFLEIPKNYMARKLKTLDFDEKGAIKLMTPGGEQEAYIVSEPGFYKIALTSRTEKAKRFTRWVTHEVLPRIRKYGYYKLTIAEQKDKCLNSIMDSLGVTELENKYYKMTLPQLERESKILKDEKSSKEEFQKVKEQYPYTYGDMIGYLNYYRWLKEIMIMHDIEKQKKYCYKLSDGTLLFSELFKERAKRYVSDPYYEWEE